MSSEPSDPSEDGVAPTGSSLNFDGLDQVLGFHVRRAQAAMHRRIMEVLGSVDLSQKQAGSLWLIGANEGTSQIGVGSALGMDRATTMAVIDKLEGRGFVVRQRSTVDRRRHELYLTPAGKQTLVEVKKLLQDHERAFAERFTPDELASFFAMLKRIYAD